MIAFITTMTVIHALAGSIHLWNMYNKRYPLTVRKQFREEFIGFTLCVGFGCWGFSIINSIYGS